MIKIDVSKTANRCEHSGDPVRVAAELAAAAGAIYNGYLITDKVAAEVFRLSFVTVLMPQSGVWNPRDGEITTMVIPRDANKKGDA